MSKPASIAEFEPDSPDFEDIVSGVAEARAEAPEVVVAPPPAPEPIAPAPGPEDFNIDAPLAQSPEAAPPPGPKKGDKDKMRQELERLSLEKKKAEEERDARQKLIEERDAQLEERRKVLEEREKELNDFKSKQFVGDPSKSPEIQAISAPWNASAHEFSSDVEALGGEESAAVFERMKEFSRQLADTQPGSDEYKEAMTQIRSALNPMVGGENLLSGLKLVRDGANRIVQIRQLMSEIQNDLPNHQYRQQAGIYDSAVREYEQIERGIFNPDPTVAQRDPLNHTVVMRAMIDGSPDVGKAAEQCKAFARFVMLPPAPISPDELEDKPENERPQLMAAHYDRHKRAYQKLRSVLPEALLARQILPSIFKRMQEAEAILASERGVLRPRLDGEAPEIEEDGEPDIKKFQPKNQFDDDFQKIR